MAGARARPWRGADPRQAARWSGGSGSSRYDGGAGAGAAGKAQVDVLEGLWVDFELVQGFFCKNYRICTIWTVRVPNRTAGKSVATLAGQLLLHESYLEVWKRFVAFGDS